MRKTINKTDAFTILLLSLVFPILSFYELNKGSEITTICAVSALVCLVSLFFRIRRESRHCGGEFKKV